jgi:hypothetical protein
MPEERPREVFPVETCPPDVAGRPTMPEGTVEFREAPHSPKLRVELAITDPHRAHGLMFRSSLSDDEGMLFSWKKEEPRGFWMRNTCLSLDMMFLDKEGVIVGVLEQVPPMNELTRSVPCPAAHVLEVRAGWTREHGVKPGQKVVIDSAPTPSK